MKASLSHLEWQPAKNDSPLQQREHLQQDSEMERKFPRSCHGSSTLIELQNGRNKALAGEKKIKSPQLSSLTLVGRLG